MPTDRLTSPSIHKTVGKVPHFHQGIDSGSITATIRRTKRRRFDEDRRYANARPPDMRTIERRQRGDKHEAKCEACSKWGHPATRCNFLGSYLCLMAFLKQKNASERKECLKFWADRNENWIKTNPRGPTGREKHTPSQRDPQQRPRDRNVDGSRSFRAAGLECMEDVATAY